MTSGTSRRALLLALGTRGDVEPFVHLGQALRARGYDVRVAVLADSAARVRAAGLRPVVAGPPAAQAMWSGSPLLRGAAQVNPGLRYLQMRRSLAAVADRVAATVVPLLAAADLVLSGLATARVVPVLAQAGIPARLVLLAPLTPHPAGTSAWSGPVWDRLPDVVEGPRQELMWGLTQGLSARLARAVARRLGSSPSGSTRWESGVAAHAYPPLLATSPVLDPRPDPAVVQTGWWADPGPVPALPEPVRTFLDGCPRPPVLLALGSTPTRSPDRRVEQLVAIGRDLGRPVVAQVAGARPRPDALVLGDVDHRALLPRVATIAHHGGSGTTHAATAAGLPQVVVPRLGDQPHQARQVHRAGLGPAPLPRTRATRRALTRRLHVALTDPRHMSAAQEAARRMATEDGLAAAVHEVEAMA